MDEKIKQERKTKIGIGILTILLLLFWSYMLSVVWANASYGPLPMLIISLIVFISGYPAIIFAMFHLYVDYKIDESIGR